MNATSRLHTRPSAKRIPSGTSPTDNARNPRLSMELFRGELLRPTILSAPTDEGRHHGAISRRDRAAAEPRVLTGGHHGGWPDRLARWTDRDGGRRRQGHLRQF